MNTTPADHNGLDKARPAVMVQIVDGQVEAGRMISTGVERLRACNVAR